MWIRMVEFCRIQLQLRFHSFWWTIVLFKSLSHTSKTWFRPFKSIIGNWHIDFQYKTTNIQRIEYRCMLKFQANDLNSFILMCYRFMWPIHSQICITCKSWMPRKSHLISNETYIDWCKYFIVFHSPMWIKIRSLIKDLGGLFKLCPQ